MGGNWVELDPKIVRLDYMHYDNYVKYYLYCDKNDKTDTKIYVPENPEEEFGVERRSGVCFSELIYEVRNSHSRSNNPVNRIYYEMTIQSNAKVKVTDEERVAWIRMTKKNKLLPSYINPAQVAKTGVLVLDLSTCTPSKLYLHLSMVRYIREEPGFVKAMVHLVKEVRMNFFIAFIYASKVCMVASGHHILSVARDYYNKSKIMDIKSSVRYMRGLYRFINNHEDYDTRKLGAKIKSGSCRYDPGNRFDCSPRIGSDMSELSASEYNYKFEELFKKDLIMSIKAETTAEAIKHLQNMRKSDTEKVEK